MSIYEALPLARSQPSEIRLLTLAPGPPTCRLNCTLNKEILDRDLEFEALSYHWGPESKLEIFVGEIAIPVTKNLFDALIHLRSPHVARVLWIDAICINQADDAEKSFQVNMMTRIYGSCQRVIVWLGLESSYTSLLPDFVAQLLQLKDQVEDGRDNKTVMRHYKSISDNVRRQIPSAEDIGWRALIDLIGRTWCDRVWIIQEVAVARDVILRCGSFVFNMKDIALAMSFAYGLNLNLHLPFKARFSTIWMERISWKQQRSRPLLRLVQDHWMAAATLPQDKVFALCGLASDAGRNAMNIKINYNKTADKVYIDFAQKVLLHYRDLRLLGSLASFSSKRSRYLPSWVPDWRVWNAGTLIYEPPEEGYTGPCRVEFRATQGSKADPEFDSSGRYVQLNGMIVDEIAEVGKIQPQAHTTSDGLRLFVNWKNIAKAKKKWPRYPTGQIRWKAFYETLTMGNLSQGLDDPEAQYKDFDFKMHGLALLWSPYATCDEVNTMRITHDISEASVWRHPVQKGRDAGVNRCFIRTKKGYYGLVHGWASRGDKVALFAGGDLPLIIRHVKREKNDDKAKERGREWQMIGDGYIHGIMFGEQWKPRKCKPFLFV